MEEVEQAKQAHSVFTFQVVAQALEDRFPEHADGLIRDFIRLLAFDALVGNNDRHFYNWGVIVDLGRRRAPRFAPVYDTARALFWNYTDQALETISADPTRRRQRLEKYVQRCFPKTGWDGADALNHFELLRRIAALRPEYRHLLSGFCPVDLPERVESLLRSEFEALVRPARRRILVDCLDRRATLFQEAVAGTAKNSV